MIYHSIHLAMARPGVDKARGREVPGYDGLEMTEVRMRRRRVVERRRQRWTLGDTPGTGAVSRPGGGEQRRLDGTSRAAGVDSRPGCVCVISCILLTSCDRDVGYDGNWDGPRTTPAPHKICCVHPKKSSIATNFESRDHYIMGNK